MIYYKYIHNERGAALVIAITLVLLVSLLVTAALVIMEGQYRATSEPITHAKLFYLAEAGMVYGMNKAAMSTNGYKGDPAELQLYGCKVHVEVDKNPGPKGRAVNITVTPQ